MSTLTDCDDQDPETIERGGSLAAAPAFEGRFETRIADLLDGTSRTSHHLVDGPHEVEVALPEGTSIPRDAIVRAFGEDFVITAEAADERGITEVELYVDGEPFGKDFEAPCEWDVVGIPEGSYEFGVVARDGPNWTPSDAINVKVGIEDEPEGTGTTGGAEPETSGAEGSTSGEPAGGTGEDDGCGCRSSGSDAGALAYVGLFGWFGIGFARRRRRI